MTTPSRHRISEHTPGDPHRRNLPRFGRRAFAAASIWAFGLPLRQASARQDQIIEPIGGASTTSDDEFIIEPQPTAVLDPDADANTIIDLAASSEVQYFAETGHNLDQPFLAAWTQSGGLSGPGAPISEPRAIGEGGTLRQDFQAIALLFDPTTGDHGSIWSAPLPTQTVNDLAPAEARATVLACPTGTTNCRFFAEAGHSVLGPFLPFWTQHGQTQFIGLPVSEQFEKSGRVSQVFTSAVLDQTADGGIAMRPVNIDIAMATFPGDDAFRPAPPSMGITTLVTAADGLRLRSGPSEQSTVIAVLPNNAEFIAAPGDHDSWVPGYVDGFSGWVAAAYLTKPGATTNLERLPATWRLDVWQGVTIGETNVRTAPTTASTVLRMIETGASVVVVEWVRGEPVVEAQRTWARLEDGGYVYARNIVRHAPVLPPPLAPDAPTDGRWIDVHLTQQLMVAYEGRNAVRTVVTTTGMPGWETPPGWFKINTRVANETMESGSIGAEDFYVLKDVLFTQYFTNRGHALHYAWWKTEETIGRPGSHGCLNLLLDDAQFFWDWASIGTPVICRTV